MQKLKYGKYKIVLTPTGSSPKLARRLWSGIVPHGPPIGHLRVVVLLQYRVQMHHLLLLLKLPLRRILHMGVKCVLYLTGADF